MLTTSAEDEEESITPPCTTAVAGSMRRMPHDHDSSGEALATMDAI